MTINQEALIAVASVCDLFIAGILLLIVFRLSRVLNEIFEYRNRILNLPPDHETGGVT